MPTASTKEKSKSVIEVEDKSRGTKSDRWVKLDGSTKAYEIECLGCIVSSGTSAVYIPDAKIQTLSDGSKKLGPL